MTQPSALSVIRNRAAVAEELRRLLPRMEGNFRAAKAVPLGLSIIDRHLPRDGLPCGALHEIVPETQGATPAAFGFIAALLIRLSTPALWGAIGIAASSPPPCGEGLGVGVGRPGADLDAFTQPRDPPPYPLPQGGRENGKLFFVMPRYGLGPGRLHGHGLNTLGLDPTRVILVETAHRRDTLWAMEEALRSRVPLAVAGLIDKLDLKLSQRLQLAAVDAGLPLLLLRPAPSLESSAAATRWRIGAAKAARDRFGLFARARWHLTLERCRNGRPGEWMVEYDHVAHRFSLAAALADPALSRGAGAEAVGKTRRA
jgi:protein ImuA